MTNQLESFADNTQTSDHALSTLQVVSRSELEAAAKNDNSDRSQATNRCVIDGTLPSFDLIDSRADDSRGVDESGDIIRLQVEPERRFNPDSTLNLGGNGFNTDSRFDPDSFFNQVRFNLDHNGDIDSLKRTFEEWCAQLSDIVNRQIHDQLNGGAPRGGHDENQFDLPSPDEHQFGRSSVDDPVMWHRRDEPTYNIGECTEPPKSLNINYQPPDLSTGVPVNRGDGPSDNPGHEPPKSSDNDQPPAQEKAPSDRSESPIESHEGQQQKESNKGKEQSPSDQPPASEPEQEPQQSEFQQEQQIIEQLIGKNPEVLEPGINQRLACALAVSEVLHQVDPAIGKTNNIQQLQQELIKADYEPVPIDQIQPGDVIIGLRPDGMPGHAAISVGDGKVFNNNSNAGTMTIDSIDKFSQGMHDEKGNWNKNGFSEVRVYRKHAS